MKPQQISDFIHYVEQVATDYRIPGLAVAAIHQGDVVVKHCVGVMRVGDTLQVSDNSLFPIASISKAMVATGLAILENQNKLKFSDRVIDILPEFKLADQEATQTMQVAETLFHNSGLGFNSSSALACFGLGDSEDVLQQLQYIKPTAAFRQVFQYQNGLYLWAAKIIEKIADMPWDEFLQAYLFKPIGMVNTYTSLQQITDKSRVCQLHSYDHGEIIPSPFLDAPDTLAPAGGLLADLNDMMAWLQFNTTGEQTVLPKSALANLFRARISTGYKPIVNRQGLTVTRNNYALGWYNFAYRAYHGVEHRGGYPGVSSFITVLPDQKTGIVLLSNCDQGRASLNAIRLRFMELCFNLPCYDWAPDLNGLMQRQLQHYRMQLQQRLKTDYVCTNLADYVGDYTSQAYGKLAITLEQRQLVMQIGTRPVSYRLIAQGDNRFTLSTDACYGVLFQGSQLLFADDKQSATLELVSHNGFGEFVLANREIITRN